MNKVKHPEQIMNDETREYAARLFTALGHETRLRIVELLTNGERTVGEIAQALALLQPNASQHLAVLHRAGVVKVTRIGAAHYYSIRGPRITRVLELVNEFRHVHSADIDHVEKVQQMMVEIGE